MIIGVHISGENIEQHFLFTAIKHLSNSNPTDSFIIFSDKDLKGLSPNCTAIIISPKPKNKLLLYYWYHYKLPKLLYTNGVSVFLSNVGMLPPMPAIKHFLLIDENKLLKEKNPFFAKKIKEAMAAASAIFTTDAYLQFLLSEKYPFIKNKIETLYIELPLVANVIDTQQTKDTVTDGFDYFLYPISQTSSLHTVTILKAFSQLKKWQKSAMHLVLLVDDASKEVIDDFKNYKYKNAVKIIERTKTNTNDMIASAYACIFFGGYADRKFVWKALQHNIPTIVEDAKHNSSLFSTAVLYTMPQIDALAAKMQVVYKDELHCKMLKQLSSELLQQHNSVTAANNLYEAIST